MKANSLPISTTSTASSSTTKNEKSKLNFDKDSQSKKLGTRTKEKLNMSSTVSSKSSNASAHNSSNNSSQIQSSSNSNILASRNSLDNKNGELLRNNRAKSSSFTPINLTSGKQLAAVLAQHKHIQAVGYEPDHEMIQKTIEIGASKTGQSNSSSSMIGSTSTNLTNHFHHQNASNSHTTNQFNTNPTKLSNNKLLSQSKFSSLNKQSSLDDHTSRQIDENNNEFLADERRKQLYLRSPYLVEALDSGTNKNKLKTLDDFNKRILFGDSSTKDSMNDINFLEKPDMPDSMASLLTRSKKAREPLVAKTSKKQLITKRKAQIKSDTSIDSGTSSPTREQKYANKTTTGLADKLTTKTGVNSNRSDFARAYALNRRSKSPILTTKQSISPKAKTGLVRSSTSTTLTDLESRLNNASSIVNSINLAINTFTTSSKSNIRPRSDYVNSKYSSKSKSTHSLNKID